ncbi:MAG: hypothetical protein J6K86_05390 [Clostridia bacterium]|nr:hypothetical protein [Clostridia bacterium]
MKKIFSVSLAAATFACTLGFSGCTKLEDASWNLEVFEFTYVQYPLSSDPDMFTVGRDKNQNVYLDMSGDFDIVNDKLTAGDTLVYVAKQQVGVNEAQPFDVYKSDDEAVSGYSLVDTITKPWSEIIYEKSYHDVYQMIRRATVLADNGATYKEVDQLESIALLGDLSSILISANCTFYSFNDGAEECAVVKTDEGDTQSTVYHAIKKDDGSYSVQFTCTSIKIDHNTNYANLVK